MVDAEDLVRALKYAVGKVAKLDCAEPFLYPVDSSVFPEYYKMIKHPMDLDTLKQNIPSYATKEDFLADAELIYSNCKAFNVPGSEIIGQAKELLSAIRDMLEVTS